MKVIKNITLVLRKVNANQLGITLPKAIQEKYDLKEGEMLSIPAIYVDEEINEFKCLNCFHVFSQEMGDENYCPSCGESNLTKFEEENERRSIN